MALHGDHTSGGTSDRGEVVMEEELKKAMDQFGSVTGELSLALVRRKISRTRLMELIQAAERGLEHLRRSLGQR